MHSIPVSLIGSSGGSIITAHTSSYLFCSPSSCTYHSHIIKIEKFSCALCTFSHSQFFCSSASFKLLTQGIRHPSRMPSLLDCYSTRDSRSLMFLQLWTALS